MKKIKIQLLYLLAIMLLSTFFSCKKDKGPVAETVSDIDGNTYKTIKIGNQTWMAENLKTTRFNDGNTIAFVTDAATWADRNIAEPMVCYYNNEAQNFDRYGALYNGYAALNPKLAPKGWHVPTQAEWEVLIDYMIANRYNFDGTKVGNKLAKSLASTFGWKINPNVGSVGYDQVVNNKSGFSGLPGGVRDNFDGEFEEIGAKSAWWSSTADPNDPNLFFARALYYNNTSFEEGRSSRKAGMPIRCVKD